MSSTRPYPASIAQLIGSHGVANQVSDGDDDDAICDLLEDWPPLPRPARPHLADMRLLTATEDL